MKRWNMWYNVDVYKLAAYLLPPFLRKKKLFSFFSVLLYPFFLLVQNLKNFRKSCIYKLNANGQVIYIEKYLNDYFNLEYKDIYITDSENNIPNVSVLYPGEAITMAVYPLESGDMLFLLSGTESLKEEDYIVNVPSYLQERINEITTLVEYNKPAGRKYTIKIYDYE